MKEEQASRMPLIGEKAPSFKAVTTQGEINFPQQYAGKWVILFSHPASAEGLMPSARAGFNNEKTIL